MEFGKGFSNPLPVCVPLPVPDLFLLGYKCKKLGHGQGHASYYP